MAAGNLDIVNLALSLLGESPIQSIDEPSAAAVYAKAQYDLIRRAALRNYNWAFALRRARLVRVTDGVSGVYRFTYQLPADCLRPLRVIDPVADRVPPDRSPVTGYEPVGDRRIACDAENPLLEYIADITDPTMFDDLFVQSFAHRLASGLATAVAGDANLAQALMNSARGLEREAAAQSGRERRDPATVNPYVEARW
jgi:hypothetical protein